MLTRLLASTAALVLLAAPAATAASGSLTDPTGDFPDIVKLTYNNRTGKVIMAMKYAGSRPMNESFYMRWGKDAAKYYQVFVSPSADLEVLRLNGDEVACDGLGVTHNSDTLVTRVVVPRGCLDEAPDKLRFRGIATEGLTNSDQTKLSAAIARG